jgi:hypothetical protein
MEELTSCRNWWRRAEAARLRDWPTASAGAGDGEDGAYHDLESARTTAAEESRRLAGATARCCPGAPDVLPELVQGESVDELDRSLVTARETVARVREQMQAQAAARIPAGSPARGGPDRSGLSPSEKIRLGIAERRE